MTQNDIFVLIFVKKYRPDTSPQPYTGLSEQIRKLIKITAATAMIKVICMVKY